MSTFDPDKSDRCLQLVNESSLAADVKEDVRRRVADYVKTKTAGTFTSLSGPLLSYIPNLSEYR